jgi:hypothetical protein
MPRVAVRPLRSSLCRFPHASPGSPSPAGKQETAPEDHPKPLTSLMKFGAGEGIRTLDPNLGCVKVTWCGRRDSNPHSQRETDFLTTSAFAAASRRSWPGLSLRHGLSAEGAARPVSTPSLNRGLGSGLAWGSSPLAFPDFERFCSTNFPVGTPIGSLLRLPISPRPRCHISAITRFVAR